MKISPFVLFLILLIVLVVSIIVGRKIGYEGFISYQQSKTSTTSFVIPSYSQNTVYKLHDNLFFDSVNANLLEIDSPAFNSTTGPDIIGNTILTTTIIPRSSGIGTNYSGNVSVMSIPQTSIGTSMTNNYNNFVYNSQSNNTDKYCVLYISWNIDTYIHIINITNRKHVGTYLASNSQTPVLNSNIYDKPAISLTTTPTDNDANNNSFLLDNYYDNQKTLYQVSKNVKFDITNATLILQTSTSTNKTISIYNRNNMSTPTVVNTPNTVSNTASTVQSVIFSPTIIEDKLGNQIILYLANGTNTVVVVLGLTNDLKSYETKNVVRFTANTIDVGSGSATSTSNIVSKFNSFLSNYWNVNSGNPWQRGYQDPSMYGYQGYPNTYSPSRGYSDDYILKTQIVPPVCPSCPSCAAGSVCGNCGGHGGSGTQSSNGGTMVSGNKMDSNGSNIVDGVENVANTGADVLKTGLNNAALGVGAVGLGIGAAGLGIGGAVSDTVSGAGSLAEKAGGGTVDLLKSAGSGTAGFVKDAGSGAVGLIKDAGSGAVGLIKDAGSGAMSLANNNNNRGEGQSGRGSQGGQGVGYTPVSGSGPQSMDQYSYYGTLPSKGSSNFMPVTADFSSFRH
uniref:Uncharacterized protein n=1 Tax=viral metagenome TaxID=1070528 RepID=A0A6C0HU58_9ZZZZ